MQLYSAKISPFAGTCRIQIYAKKLSVDIIEVGRDADWDDVRLINPIGKIPVLVDNKLVIPEATVICEYLEDKYPQAPMRPDNPVELAKSRLVGRIADIYIMSSLMPLFAHLSRKHRNQEVVDGQLLEIDKGLNALEHHMAATGFAVTSQLTLADCHVVPVLKFLEVFLPYFGAAKPFEKFAKITRYWTEVQVNTHIRRVLAEIEEGIAEKSNK